MMPCSDLIHLGKYKDVNYADDLFKSKEEMKVLQYKIMNNPKCHASIRAASAMVEGRSLNNAGMRIFLSEFKAAMSPQMVKKNNNCSLVSCDIVDGNNGKTFHFISKESKCPGPCKASMTMAFGICRHVIKNRFTTLEDDNLFDLDLVDKRYHYQNSINHIPRNNDINDPEECATTSEEIKVRLETMRKARTQHQRKNVGFGTSAVSRNDYSANHHDITRIEDACIQDILALTRPTVRKRKLNQDPAISTNLSYDDMKRIMNKFASQLSNCGDENFKNTVSAWPKLLI